MAKLPAIHLYPGDWLRDSVSGCSLEAQGLWLRLMFLMHDSERYGCLTLNGAPMPPEYVARRVGLSQTAFSALLNELFRAGVPGRMEDGTIYSRRMVRDGQAREKTKDRVGKFRSKNIGVTPDVTADVTHDVTHQKRTMSEDENEDEEVTRERGAGENPTPSDSPPRAPAHPRHRYAALLREVCAWEPRSIAKETELMQVCRGFDAFQPSPDEVRLRAKRYRESWKKIPLTPKALLDNWDAFAGPPEPEEDIMRRDRETREAEARRAAAFAADPADPAEVSRILAEGLAKAGLR